MGIAGGAAAGGALANRAGQLPAGGLGDRAGAGADRRSDRMAERPQQRDNWSERSQNRNEQWNQRVDNRSESWNQWQDNSQQRRDSFQQNREGRWDNLENARSDRQKWRDQNREDWQQHRGEMWDYRFDRADEIWGNARDFYDDCFDDRWWGHVGWGYGSAHLYPVNPWWWWRPITWAAATSFVYASAPPPVYVDYGNTVVYEGDTVYVDNKPIPAAKYNEPIVELAENAEQTPPPAPVEPGKPEEWMPLGVFALAQEEKGEPVMFFQISVNREGVISGGYQNSLTGDQKMIAGQVDKETQNVAWRIGDNKRTILTTTLANLTQDVSTVAIHFDRDRVQTWLLVRMPEPPLADQAPKAPEIARTVPPANPIPVNTVR
ncbi:MAG: mu-protocadherin-cell-suface protein [Luteolibacter sp.]